MEPHSETRELPFFVKVLQFVGAVVAILLVAYFFGPWIDANIGVPLASWSSDLIFGPKTAASPQ